MKKCPKCGSEVLDEARFCPECGCQMPENNEAVSSTSVTDVQPSQDAYQAQGQAQYQTPYPNTCQNTYQNQQGAAGAYNAGQYNGNQYNGQMYQNPYQTQSLPMKNTGLEIAAFVLSFLIPLVGLIMGIVDVTTHKENKHGFSIAAISISAVYMVLTIIFIVILAAET